MGILSAWFVVLFYFALAFEFLCFANVFLNSLFYVQFATLSAEKEKSKT